MNQDLRRSLALYRAFKAEQSEPDHFYRLLAEDAVKQVGRHAPIEGATVLDVGGGVGYSTDAFRAAGARCVLVEPDVRALQASKDGVVTREAAGTPHWVAVAPGRTVSSGSIIGDGYRLPFADSTADVSFSSNVLEHVEDPQSFISELVRVTKPNGIIYISFTNWYSPWGGHETRPWHYLGGEWSARRYRKRTGYDPVHHFGHSLFPVHVGPLLRWARSWDEVEVAEAVPRYYPSWCNWLVRVPALREVATWNLLLILRKRQSQDHRDRRVAISHHNGAADKKAGGMKRKPAQAHESHTVQFQARYLSRYFLRRVKYLLGHEPAFLPILLRLTPLGTSRQITEATDLVIEGFPRSANTFATYAIQDASGYQLAIASHVHQPSQVKRALARGLPTVLVIRDPISAVASYLVYDQRFSASTIIGEYCSYHRQLVPYAERLLICEFDEVTADISSVINRINVRYSLHVPPFSEEPSSVKRVLAQIDWTHKLIHPGLDPVKSSASPQTDRRQLNEQMRESILHPRYAAQLSRAQDLFEFFCNIVSQQRDALSRSGPEEKRSTTMFSEDSASLSFGEGGWLETGP